MEPITPIDGRYRDKVQELAPFFSEYGLTKYRIFVELQYLQKLSAKGIIPKFTKQETAKINNLFGQFDSEEFRKVKKIESEINHDVKAVEYYIRKKFQGLKLETFVPYIHLGLTSYDINDISYALMLKDATGTVLVPLLENLLLQFKDLAKKTKNVVLLGRTHGQPAIPTTFGKEMANYYYRLKKQYDRLKKFRFEGKLNGAVGNYNAHFFTYPKVNWIAFSEEFIRSFGLEPNLYTTQLLPHDNWIEFFQILTLINGILVDASVNFWIYIMNGILVQKKAKQEVGSSTMPQKVNPINFENAEGVLQMANAQFEFYARKLVSSRLQRDLSDSTVRRTFGIAFAYTVLGWKSVIAGMKKISVDEDWTAKELNEHWEVLAEALQTYLRSTGDEKAYEKLKDLTRGKRITKESYLDILEKLKLDKEKKFIDLTPEKYLGLAEKLTEQLL